MSNLTDALQIKNETEVGANTALRVGSLFESIVVDQVADEAAIALNSAKVGITPTQAANIVTNNSKISYDDAAVVSQHTLDINTLNSEQSTQDAAIALNTAKVGITPTQAADILANNDKISYTDAAAVALNTEKVGIINGGTTGQVLAKASAIDKDVEWIDPSSGPSGPIEGTEILSTGETVGKVLQANGDGSSSWSALPGGGDALTANPLSQFASTTKAQLNSVISDGVPLYVGDVTGITPTQASDILTNNDKISYDDATIVSQHTIDIDDLQTSQGVQDSVIALNTAKVGITPTQAANIVANNSKISFENGSTYATKTGTETLTNKTLSSPAFSGQVDLGANSLGSTAQSSTGAGGTLAINWGLGNLYNFKFGAFNQTFTFTAPTKPGTFILKLVQDSVGSRTVTWPATVKWSGATAPTLTTTANTGTDIITFYYDGTIYFAVSTLNFG